MDYLKDAPPVLREYLIYMHTIMGRSVGTVNQYFLDLRIFFRFILQKRALVPETQDFDTIDLAPVDLSLAGSVTRSEVYDFLLFSAQALPKHHKSPETAYGNSAKARARKLSALRGFYRYCCEKQHYFENNPTLGIESPKNKQSLPKFLNLQESLDLLKAIDGPYAQRDYAIITLFLNCGLRVSELVGLNLEDISGDRLRVLGKGNKERIVYLNTACQQAIEAYLPFRIAPKPAHRRALFISRLGNRINAQTVKWLVNKYLEQAGLAQKHMSVHKLRHTAATLMYQNGVDVRTLKEVLGHESLDTTMIYTHVLDENLKQAADKNPLGKVRMPTPKKTPDKAVDDE